jgi:hypothetical protein
MASRDSQTRGLDLPAEEAPWEALLGREGAVRGASAQSGFVECSTVSPDSCSD